MSTEHLLNEEYAYKWLKVVLQLNEKASSPIAPTRKERLLPWLQSKKQPFRLYYIRYHLPK